jgi:putative heme-binding domain-containing protein
MAEVGPDGQVWVIDWYNYIVQHNPTPQGFETGKGRAYVTELRDKKYGRIYRVVYGKSTQPVFAEPQVPQALVAQLRDPTMVVRLMAQRLLVERGQTDVVPGLLELLADPTVDAIGMNVAAIHALHVLKGLGALDSDESRTFTAAVAALRHAAAGVRVNALRVLPDTPATLAAIESARVLTDQDPQVKLAALLALSDLTTTDAGSVVASALQQAGLLDDPWLHDAATSAAAMHAHSFLATVMVDRQEMSQQGLSLIRRVAEHFARGKPEKGSIEELLSPIANQLDSRPTFAASYAAAVVEGLSAGWPDDHYITISPQAAATLPRLFQSLPDASKAVIVSLSQKWGSHILEKEIETIEALLLAIVANAQQDLESRMAAAKNLIAIDPSRSATVKALGELINPLASPEFSIGIVRALSSCQTEDLGEHYLELIQKATPAVREALIEVMLTRPNLTRHLLAAIQQGSLRLTDLTTVQRQFLADHPDEQIRRTAKDVIREGGAMVNVDREQVISLKMPLTLQTGDADAGKQVFTKNCATCHVYKGEGTTVGPNLTGMSVHPKSELLIHILDPSRSVEANYRLYTLLTLDGTILSGLLTSESRTTVELIDAQGRKHVLLREDIDQLRPSTKSAMPEGLESSIDDRGFVNLLEFLTQVDRFVPIPLEKYATTITTQGMFYDRASLSERIVFDDWNDKVVDGIPFALVNPREGRTNNAILMNGPIGPFAPHLPKSVVVPCLTAAKAIYILGGVGGWAARSKEDQGVSLVIRLHYVDGKSEDHALSDGVHIADYNGLFDVPGSTLAFNLNGRQLRYLAVEPKRDLTIENIELLKPDHKSAPLVMAITVETLNHR